MDSACLPLRGVYGGVYGAAAENGTRDAPHELEAEERSVLALARERRRLDQPRLAGIEEADVGGGADRERARGHSEDPLRTVRHAPERVDGLQTCLLAPLERVRQEEFERGRAGLGLAERHLLRVVVDRRVVRTDRVDRAI